MNRTTLGAAAALALAAGAIGYELLPDPPQAPIASTVAQSVVEVCDGDAGTCRLCEAEIDMVAGIATSVRRVTPACGPVYSAGEDIPVPGKLEVAGGIKGGQAAKPARQERVAIASAAGPALAMLDPFTLGCACADATTGAAECLWQPPAGPRGEEQAQSPAPPRTTLQPGTWSGDGCLQTVCVETSVRDTCGGPGCQMNPLCIPAGMDAGQPGPDAETPPPPRFHP